MSAHHNNGNVSRSQDGDARRVSDSWFHAPAIERTISICAARSGSLHRVPARGPSLDRDPPGQHGGLSCDHTPATPLFLRYFDRGSRAFVDRSKRAGSPMNFQFDDSESAARPLSAPGPGSYFLLPPWARAPLRGEAS